MTEGIIILDTIPLDIIDTDSVAIIIGFKMCTIPPDYYSEYKVFHKEASIYNIRSDEDKSLVWVGIFDIVDPYNITSTVKDYVNRIALQLEREAVIKKVSSIQ